MPDTKQVISEKILGIIAEDRISSQKLLQQIYKKIDEGCTEFEILASGQHNIGGSVWSKEGKTLKFKVKNPGQRVGSMGLLGTQIIVEGSAPADVGWLNAGAEIIVKGDGGDTTAHCAATGKIFIGGRVGTRSGALMKHDPSFPAPEFWILKNTGSFSFEFMNGGIAVVCGSGCESAPSVIGNRSCVGMVGGTVFVRGNVLDLSNDVWLLPLDEKDKDFLLNGIPDFLEKIGKDEIMHTLLDFSQWKKIVAKTFEERKVKSLKPIKDFRLNNWVEGGIFGDLIQEDYHVANFVEKDELRLRYPEWKNHVFASPCEYNCPVNIPTQRRIGLLRAGKTEEALKLVLDYSPFPASVCGQVCPNLCLDECNRKYIDTPVKIADIGMLSKDIKVEITAKPINKSVAVIGSGVAGLTAAYHLKKMGYIVDVLEQDSILGGKLKQVIPEERLNQEVLEAELNRFKEMGIGVKTNINVDKTLFSKLEKDYNAIVIAVGAHVPVVIPFEGHDRLIKGLDFLKAVNKGEKVTIGNNVVVIGAGNAAMDVVIGAYNAGAKKVTAIDIQKPAAFEKEIEHAKKLGAELLWPCFTEKVTSKGVHLKDGRFLEADTVIISVGDRTDFSFLSNEYLDERGKTKLNEYMQTEANSKVFVTGDAIKQGLFTHAIGDGRKVAININNMLEGKALDGFKRAPMIPQDKVKDEYYHPMNPQKVSEMEVEQECDRCMSCGLCRDCSFCMDVCPETAITRVEKPNGAFEYISDPKKCIGCGICSGVCPCGIWTMYDNMEKYSEA